MRIGLIGLACLLIVGCQHEPERVIDLEQIQDRNGVAYELNTSEPYTGRVIGTYANGQKQFEANFVNGGEEGVDTRWYENGQKKSEDTYVNAKLEGVATRWRENGEVRLVTCWENDEEVSMDNCQ